MPPILPRASIDRWLRTIRDAVAAIPIVPTPVEGQALFGKVGGGMEWQATSSGPHAPSHMGGSDPVSAAGIGAAPASHAHTLAAVLDAGDMAAVDEAPSDGQTYGRKNGAWGVAGGTQGGGLGVYFIEFLG